jgi:oligopeptide/dipeptide ABC transporter ATP-binding protein
MAGNPILDVRGLRVAIATRRGTLHAVDGVSFMLNPGEMLGLAGESGCGKTITLRAIAGLLPRQAGIAGGEIHFDGRRIDALSERERNDLRGRGIGFVFQEPMTALNPLMRIGDQIGEGPRRHLGYGRRRAREWSTALLRMVGIPDPAARLRSYPHELSGGMRQRVMLAIALSSKPKILLCDEPTTALDVTIQDQVLKALVGLREELNLAIVLVTHDLAVIAETCERTAIMYAGEIVESGPTREVLRAPLHPYTAGLLSAIPAWATRTSSLAAIPGAPPDLADPPRGCRFHPRCPLAQPACRREPTPLRQLSGARKTACLYPELLRSRHVATPTTESFAADA